MAVVLVTVVEWGGRRTIVCPVLITIYVNVAGSGIRVWRVWISPMVILPIIVSIIGHNDIGIKVNSISCYAMFDLAENAFEKSNGYW